MANFMNRLLLATERTEHDAGSERVAIAMAQRCQLPLSTVLPLVSNPEYEALAPQIALRAEQEAARKVALLRAQAEAAGVAIELRVRRGEEAYLEIVEEARAQGSELIVIRRRGKRSFLANLLVGEMVSKVIAHATCHVMIVPTDAQMWRSRVLAAVEPGEQGRRIAALAGAVAAQCQLPLTIVSVVASPAQQAAAEHFVQGLRGMPELEGITVQTEVRVGRAYAEILAAATGCGADLLVIGSRSDQPINRAHVGGEAQKLLGLSLYPVLLVNTLVSSTSTQKATTR